MTTFTDPFRIMYQEVPSSPWLNTRCKKIKRLMTRIGAHQYKLQLIKSSFKSPEVHIHKMQQNYWQILTYSGGILFLFIWYMKEERDCITCTALKDNFFNLNFF